MEEIRPVKPGDAVRVVTEDYRETVGLVTCVHGYFAGQELEGQNITVPEGYVPCINVVYVTDDEKKRDPYGQQVERMSSLQHYVSVKGMPRPGRYWTNI